MIEILVQYIQDHGFEVDVESGFLLIPYFAFTVWYARSVHQQSEEFKAWREKNK
jgi:hypothetical protein